MNRWYEGMDATSEAELQFEVEHTGHRVFQSIVETPSHVLVTRCIECAVEFHEYSAS